MPAVHFEVKWPDGETQRYYSPSTIIHEFLKTDVAYSQEEFSHLITQALNEASQRVYKKFGYYCSAAMGELDTINEKLQSLSRNGIAGEIRIQQFN